MNKLTTTGNKPTTQRKGREEPDPMTDEEMIRDAEAADRRVAAATLTKPKPKGK